MIMENTFELLPWHDAELLNICIDRSDSGNNDIITLSIIWPDGQYNNIIFFDCYKFDAELNFGIIAKETIREAIILNESDRLNEIRNKWNKIGVNLSDLKCIKIDTNSTNSSLIIYSKGFKIT